MLTIAIDYDNTITADPEYWLRYIEHTIKSGHQPIIVSCRTDNRENREEIQGWLGELLVPVVLTSHRPKRYVAGGVDVWIDDKPEAILFGEPERLKQKVVFTNGCFDMLHVGHLTTLEFAKQQGDVLIVGINSDSSVRQLKGPTRPIIPQEERARMIKALRCVDQVIVFDELTVERLLREVKPDVYVRGGTSVLNEKELLACRSDCTITVAPASNDVSTTTILGRIANVSR